MADSQVKARNLCNIVSTTTLHNNAGGSGTFIRNNSIAVYMNGSDNTSGVYIAILPEAPNVGETFTISFSPICPVDNVLRLNLFGVVQTITYTSGQRVSITFTTPSNVSRLIAFYGGNLTEKTVQIYNIQLESGSTAHDYQPYSSTGWVHSLRELKTAYETVQSGDTIYTDGTAITSYTIKGNTIQNGTPSPSNPITISGVGNKTANLASNLLINDTSAQYATILMFDADLEADTTYTLSFTASADIRMYMSEAIFTQATYLRTVEGVNTVTVTTKADLAKTSTNYQNGRWLVAKNTVEQTVSINITNVMLNTGSTAKPYEPYGYKIPISNGQASAVNYLGSVTSNRQIKKLVLTGDEDWDTLSSGDNLMFRIVLNDTMTNSAILSTHFENKGIYSTNTVVGAFIDNTSFKCRPENVSSMTVNDWKYYLQQQYAAGVPVIIWYVLATPETAAVNEPLMKIGTYADTLSNATAIPTTEGANSITVDTTVQPSEFTATWTGWHDASVKEWDGSQWNE